MIQRRARHGSARIGSASAEVVGAPPPDRRKLGRRGLLTGGLATVGGGVLVAGASGVASAAQPTIPGALTLVLHGTDWQLTAPPPAIAYAGTPALLPTTQRTVGRFVDDAGNTLGSFKSTAIGDGAEGPDLQILTLKDGLIFGLGSGPLAEAEYAVVGGTGRYLGATGGYTARQSPRGTGSSGTAEFTITLSTITRS